MSAEGSRAKVAFLGDSITEGWIRTGFSARRDSLPQPECERIWRQAFGRWSPLNFGIGGDRVQDIGWRIQPGRESLLTKSPNFDPLVWVLLLGTNDLGSGEMPQVVTAEIAVVVAQLHAARPDAQILLHAILPRGGDEGDYRDHARFHRSNWWVEGWNNHFSSIKRVNAELRELAGSRSWLHYCDCGERFLRAVKSPASQVYPKTPSAPFPAAATKTIAQSLQTGVLTPGGHSPGTEVDENLYIEQRLMYDLLHLSPDGYREWAACLLPAIQRLMV